MGAYSPVMTTHPLAPYVLASVTAMAIAFAVAAWRALGHRFGLLLAVALVVAASFSHVPVLRATLPTTFPAVAAVGVALAIASLFSASARRAFGAMSDADTRLVLAFRAVFGGLLFALAATGHLPYGFAITAGLGDLAVGLLALTVPGRLDASGARLWRVVVHGAGALDMLQVIFLAVTVVRPWSIAHDNVATAMTLPWVVVPLMLAVNAHGLLTALRATTAEPSSDGSEPARRVRRAVPNA